MFLSQCIIGLMLSKRYFRSVDNYDALNSYFSFEYWCDCCIMGWCSSMYMSSEFLIGHICHVVKLRHQLFLLNSSSAIKTLCLFWHLDLRFYIYFLHSFMANISSTALLVHIALSMSIMYPSDVTAGLLWLWNLLLLIFLMRAFTQTGRNVPQGQEQAHFAIC